MALYEHVFIARQDISSTQVDGLVEAFEKIIADNGGTVAKREYWGLRNLAFRIKKNRKGHYVLFNLDSPPFAVAELERNLRFHEDILRFMTVRVDALEEVPSVMMQGRGKSDERARRNPGAERGDALAGSEGVEA